MKGAKTIYHVSGTLCKGFVGQIAYTVCLEGSYEELDIEFSFNHQHFGPGDVTPKLKKEIEEYCEREYQLIPATEEEEEKLFRDMKTEIHTLAELNGTFIGCVHRQMTTRHMYFSGTEATEGCIPVDSVNGVLKVTILVFNVLMDGTDYKLTVRVR